MPLADSIHAHQVVFSFALNEPDIQSFQALHKEFSLVTMVPEKFDLAKLINGGLTRFKASVHANHFERGGELKLQDVEVEITQLLLTRSLGDQQGGHYYQVSLDQSSSMLIHRIVTRPSFDQILIARSNQQLPGSELVKLTNGEPWSGASIYGSAVESIYLETRDFQ
jgi:hypothetical protein